jgi:hypothetical protein
VTKRRGIADLSAIGAKTAAWRADDNAERSDGQEWRRWNVANAKRA